MDEIVGGRWKVQARLGEGGQGETFVVYNLQDAEGPRSVLKRLKRLDGLARFRREIEAIQQLDDERIVKLLDFSLDPQQPFLVTELCIGGSLEDNRARFEGRAVEALNVVAEIADGLSVAHKRGLVHRDIKPGNILFDDRDCTKPVIGDFGICYFENGERLTLSNEPVGARLFIAPELEGGRAKDVVPQSDLYSLGKVLYWMLWGGSVFPREGHREHDRNLIFRFARSSFEHVNRLLDELITVSPGSRLASADLLAYRARDIVRLIQMGAHALNPD